MLHPSYSDLMKVVNREVEQGEAPIVNSRYSIVMATSRRARQIIAGEDAMVEDGVRRTGFGLVRRLSEPFPPEPEFRQTLM